MSGRTTQTGKGVYRIIATIIDSPPGWGKTTAIIDYINANSDKLFIVVVVYKKQQDRYQELLKSASAKPKYINYAHRKLDDLKNLLEQGHKCIVTTHNLFLDTDMEVVNLIKSREYNLIIDEAISCVDIISTGVSRSEYNDFNELENLPILTKGEIEWLFANKMIKVTSGNRIAWTGKPGEDHRYLWVEKMAKVNGLVFINDTILIWRFPPIILKNFLSVTILTYQFERSVLCSYFKAYGIDYELKGLKIQGDKYTVTGYNLKTENRKKYLNLINVCNDKALNAIGEKCGKENPLSVGWYKKAGKGKKELLKKLCQNATNYLRHKVNAPRESVLWTTYRKHKDTLAPIGYKTVDEAQKIPSFVSCNAKASNDYITRYNLINLTNIFLNPNIAAFFSQQGISVDEEGFAQNELLQWLFRSRLRELKPINLYLPSERMRRILREWAE